MLHIHWPLFLLCSSIEASVALMTFSSAAAQHPHRSLDLPPARIETETHSQKVIDSIAVDPPCQAEGPAAFPLASNEGRGKTSPEGFPLQCTQPGKADPAGRSCTGLCRQSRLPSRAPSRALPLSSALNSLQPPASQNRFDHWFWI